MIVDDKLVKLNRCLAGADIKRVTKKTITRKYFTQCMLLLMLFYYLPCIHSLQKIDAGKSRIGFHYYYYYYTIHIHSLEVVHFLFSVY